MAKAKYERWLTPEGLELIADWARHGFTDEQIAKKMGISRKSLSEWKKTYSDIGDTLKKNKEVVDAQVENTLLKRALGFKEKIKKPIKTKEISFEDGKRIERETIQYEKEEVYYPPDTTAAIFWLKNRRPEIWRDKPKEEVKVDNGITVVFKGEAEEYSE